MFKKENDFLKKLKVLYEEKENDISKELSDNNNKTDF